MNLPDRVIDFFDRIICTLFGLHKLDLKGLGSGGDEPGEFRGDTYR